ncbi:gamma-aminobutyric acid receptor subunit beta-like [Apis florea]|uniref:gamma-aminobutyric acid receptor subunit beta-like n=1 Tax=Apis florea TaxID=7463 RepID=UPI0006292DC7|nr:gamma-aminobutyric acid receptor subunit beta-like [Apis florea]
MLNDVNISAILDSFSVSYDKRVRPNYGGPPVEVGVTMYVLSISSVSEVLMVQFAFSNSYRTHNDSRPFISLLLVIFTY